MNPVAAQVPLSRPPWLKVRLQDWHSFKRTEDIVELHGLNTVCFSAHCPNIAECWGRGTATLMLLGNTCTRRCGFCAVLSGKPAEFDPHEPQRVAQAVKDMGLKYAVLTSVARDDLPDGGASIFAESIRAIRRTCPGVGVEVLIPDLQGNDEHLDVVFDAQPDVLNHNVETVRRLQRLVRPSAAYARSLYVLRRAAEKGLVAKSGLMLGLGETDDEVRETIRDLRDHGVRMLTVGQYLRPDDNHLPVARYATPEQFEALGAYARSLGFEHVESAPLVRSSYHAEEAPAAHCR
ncbi:MAG: lipoyl synthase [Planctomycetota bacterium]|nr:lipoyl synthase [Planctomycetota bacterium]